MLLAALFPKAAGRLPVFYQIDNVLLEFLKGHSGIFWWV
jgi:hypothetical protein